MTVSIRLVEGADESTEINHPDLVYKVTDGGVLIVLRPEARDFAIDTEYSPSAWLKVTGTRYVGSLDKLPGLHGTAKTKPSEMKRN